MHKPDQRQQWLALPIILIVFCGAFFGEERSHSGSSQHTPQQPSVSTGVVVDKVEPEFDGVKTGIQEGDILLRWTRGEAQGEIVSPFTLWLVELEQKQLGTVTLEGLRGPAKLRWTLGPDIWKLSTRPNFAGLSLSTYQEGQKLASAKRFSDAGQKWQSVMGDPGNADFVVERVWLLFHAAEVFSKAQQWELADSYFQQAIDLAGEGRQPLAVPLFIAWGDSFLERRDWAGAERSYRQALEYAKRPDGSKLQEAACISAQGLVAGRRGDLVQAEDYYRQALAIQIREAPDALGYANLLLSLAAVLSERGDLDAAQEYYESALSQIRRIEPDSRRLAATLVNLGGVMINRGDLDKAEKYYREALVFQEKYGKESPAYAEGIGNLALVAWQRGDLAAAEESLLRTTTILQKALPNSLNVAIGFTNLGFLAVDRGEDDKAEKYFRGALALEEKLAPGSLGAANCLNALSTLELKHGALEQAGKDAHLALAMQTKLAPRSVEVATTLLTLAQISKARGDLVAAEQYDRSALEIMAKQSPGSLAQAQVLEHLGEVFLARGDLAQAEDYYRQTLAIRERLAPGSTGHAESLAALAALSAKAGKDTALRLYEEALHALESQNARFGGSSDVRAGFRARHAAYYHEYASLLLAHNKPEEAFAAIERSRARTLLETLNEAHIDIHSGANALLVQHEVSLEAALVVKSERRARLLTTPHTEEQIKAVEKEISDLTSEYQDVQAEIRSTNPAYAALTQPRPLAAKEIQQQLLDPDTMLLEYSLGEERSLVFALTPGSLRAYELPKRAEIEQEARAVHRLLTAERVMVRGESPNEKRGQAARNRASFDRAVASLGRMVLGPLAEQLQNKRLLIVTDGALAYVPFALLPEPRAPDAAQNGDSVPLIVNHEIINLPSASVLAVLRQQQKERKRSPKAVAVLADPVFDLHDSRLGGMAAAEDTASPQTRSGKHDSLDDLLASDFSANLLTRSAADLGLARGGQLALPRLRFSRREADAILSVTPAGQGLEAVDFNASRATATSPELGQYRIVHFATHGLLNSEHPELSGLVLSLIDKHGRPQNGFLMLQDIYNLELPADLVVLSACETGLGKETSGEGLIGLTRGFMYAGASRVVASLWKVSDAATAQLMANFYRAMEQDKLTPAAALRSAQIAMWKQHRWRHPYYWAA
ncbi:MAG TPA: CHAT domain-containing protein, partial [Terriglobales bacterium]|nr:CHAT domain-containing protein [Terriglobales bacterium]